MDKKQITYDLGAYMQSKGDLDVGFCSATPFDSLKDIYEKRINEKLACEFEYRDDVNLLIDPQRQLDNAKSFVVIVVPHRKYEMDTSSTQGRMSAGTASLDYHRVIEHYLKDLKCHVKDTYDINSKIIVDTSPLSDRAIAVRAGLGIVRRNNMFYHRKYGSYVHIGSLLLDLELDTKDKTQPTDPCGQCAKCIEFCPGSAIIGDYTINSQTCVSYLTQKKTLSVNESKLIGKMVYGCDVCQSVCPANRGVINPDGHLIVDELVDIEDLLDISNATFNDTYKMTASGWRGKRTLQRNGLAILGNSGQVQNKEIIERFINDERPIIRDEARRALDRLDELKG